MKNLAQAIHPNQRSNLKVATIAGRKATSSRQAAKTDMTSSNAEKKPQLTLVVDEENIEDIPTLPSSSKLTQGNLPKNEPLDKLANSTLKEWHPEEQPRERLMKHGPQALATSELIAILLRSGTKSATAVDVARNLLLDTNGHLRELASRDWRALEKVHGIGAVKAVTLVAALELGRRRGQESDVERPTIRTAQTAFQILGPQLADLRHEECWVLFLNTACRLIGTERLSSGGVDGTVVDVRKLMAMALRFNATSFVLAHNHPSGNLTPSSSDISLTRNLVSAGKILNIQLLDHLIVAGHKYYSFSDENMLSG
ncbi:MAG: DNA repair protein RadC [Saprospiraceae bacterium]